MYDTAARSSARRRRSAVVGLVLGALLGTMLAGASGRAAAERHAGLSQPVFDATHLPPLLTAPGDDVALRYDVHCASTVEGSEDRACNAGGTVFVRAGMSGRFQRVPLALEPSASEGSYVARIPKSIAGSALGFSYYAVLHAVLDDGRATGSPEVGLTLPVGGAASPHRSLPLGSAVEVSLGRHEFGRAQTADERVVTAQWGSRSAEIGLEGGTGVAPVGGSSFDVDAQGGVLVLDQVNRRVLRWSARDSTPTTSVVSVDGTIADLSVAADGTMHVLEGARAGRGPTLRTFDRFGVALAVTELDERTATQVRMSPSGPLVLQHPSGQWWPVSSDENPVSESGQSRVGLPGRVFPNGQTAIVLRTGNELRLALTSGNVVRRSWRVTSSTPLGEVQLTEPMGNGLLIVVRVYTDAHDEFVALVLGPHGLLRTLSLDSSDWAESAPLSRFRLSGTSLYQLGSTRAGLFVERFDLEEEQ